MAKKIAEKVLLAKISTDKYGLSVLNVRLSETEKWKKVYAYTLRRCATRGAERAAKKLGCTKVCYCKK